VRRQRRKPNNNLHRLRTHRIFDYANSRASENFLWADGKEAVLESMRQFKAGVFQALAHPTRVAIMEYLAYGEMSVGHLCEKIGIEQANASQHLAVLRNKHLVETRKDGNQIFYRLRDPLLGDVFEALRKFFLSHISEALATLRTEKQEAEANKADRETGR
jgi:DNA-binding transcriptional ArsR family regulator